MSSDTLFLNFSTSFFMNANSSDCERILMLIFSILFSNCLDIFSPVLILKANTKPFYGTPSRIRTCDPRFRRPMLYPSELWAHYLKERGYEIRDMHCCKSKAKQTNHIIYEFAPPKLIFFFLNLNQSLF